MKGNNLSISKNILSNMKVITRQSNIMPFGGLNLIRKFFYKKHIDRSIDKFLGRRKNGRKCTYQISDIFLSLINIFLSGGDHIEDITSHRYVYQTCPDILVPSSDTVRRFLKESSEDNLYYASDKNTFAFNTAQEINKFLLCFSQHLGLLPSSGEIDIDFDHVFLPTEKYDTKRGYKEERGYFPGVASSNGIIVYVENRDGNTPVTFRQEKTLGRMFDQIRDCHLSVNRFRADCGSYTKDVIQTLQKNCKKFYLRASKNSDLLSHVKAYTCGIKWKKVIINDSECEVQSVPYTPTGLTTSYRLVVKRDPDEIQKDGFFKGQVISYTYWCILTKNTTFLIFTAMVKNFYTAFLRKIKSVLKT